MTQHLLISLETRLSVCEKWRHEVGGDSDGAIYAETIMSLKFPFQPGDRITKSSIHLQLGGTLQQAMTSCLQGSAFLLFHDPKTAKKYGYDMWEGRQPDGSFHYTGQGTKGDQSLSRGNRVLMNAHQENKPIYLFTREARPGDARLGNPYTYVERVRLGETPYTLRQAPDIRGELRWVFVFVLETVIDSERTIF